MRELQESELRAALLEVQREEQDRSRVLPWIVLSAGIAMAVTGVALGAGKVLTCEDSCTAPFWPAWLVMAGATAGTAGGVWLLLKERDLAELRSRRYQIETQLQWLEWSVANGSGTPRAAITLRYAF